MIIRPYFCSKLLKNRNVNIFTGQLCGMPRPYRGEGGREWGELWDYNSYKNYKIYESYRNYLVACGGFLGGVGVSELKNGEKFGGVGCDR